MAIEWTIHLQYIVTLSLCSLHEWMLIDWIVDIEQDYIVVLVGLVLLNKLHILFWSEVLALG